MSAASAPCRSGKQAEDSRRFGSPEGVDALTRPVWASCETISCLIINFGVRPVQAR